MKQLFNLQLGIVFLTFMWACGPETEVPVLPESVQQDLTPIARNFFEIEKPNQKSIHAKLHQDYYSIELAYEFFEAYGEAIDQNPYLFVTYSKQFLLSSMHRNEISNPNRCFTSSQGRYEN